MTDGRDGREQHDSTTDRSTRSAVAATGAATFCATRDELVGDGSLLGSAEIARSYCANADRVVSVVAVTPGRIRRVDCWLGGAGFVTHAASADPGQPLLGSVADRDRAVELTTELVGSLVGELRSAPVETPVELGVVGAIAADAIPDGAEWVVIVSARTIGAGSEAERIVVAGRAGGLALAPLESLDGTTRATAATRADLVRGFDELLGRSPRSVEELLADDRPRPRDGTSLPDWGDAARVRPAGHR